MDIFLGLGCSISGVVGLLFSLFVKRGIELREKEDGMFSQKGEFEYNRQQDVGMIVFGIFLMYLLRQDSFFAPASVYTICIMCFLGLFDFSTGVYKRFFLKDKEKITLSFSVYYIRRDFSSGIVYFFFALLSSVWKVVLYFGAM